MRTAILTWAADLTWRRPWTIIITALVLALLSGTYAALWLDLNADTDDLISPSRPFMEQYRRFLNEFGDLEYLYVAVSDTQAPPRTREAVDALTERLRRIDSLPRVYSGVTPAEQRQIATRAMTDDELADLAAAARGFPPFLESRGPAGVVEHANALLRQLLNGGVELTTDQQEELAAGAVFALSAIAAAREESASRNRLAPLFEERQREYFRSETGDLYFVVVIPDKDFGTLAIIEEPLRWIRAAMDEVRQLYPGIQMGLTGKAVLQADEMATTAEDTTRAAILAFVLVATLFMIVLRGVYKPALAAVAFLCAGAWTYGFATLAIGYLNLLSIVFALVLVGIGFDFGVHLIARYNEYRSAMPVREAIRQSLLHSGPANITSAFTSAMAFLTALFTPFRGLQELGLVAGAGLIFCLVSMMLVLPALLTVFERNRRAVSPGTDQAPELRSGVLKWVLARPGTLLLVAASATVVLLMAEGRVRFEDNLLELQSPNLESVRWEHRLIAESPSMTWFGVVIANTQEEALELLDRARAASTIGMVRSAFIIEEATAGAEVAGVVRPDSPRRTALRAALHEHGTPTGFSNSGDFPDPAELHSAARTLDLVGAAAVARDQEQAGRLQRLSNDLRWIAERLQPGHPQEPQVRQHLRSTIDDVGTSLRALLQGDRLALHDALPEALRDQYVSALTGRYLVLLHPRANVWEYDALHQFVSELREVDPGVTGAPIATYESMHDMRTAFVVMAVLAFLAVMLLVWLDFRSVRYAALAMAPLVLGLVWLTEIMGLADISFNLANFFSVSILLGVTVDSAVHVLHRHREGGPSRLHLGSTRRAVILTSMTTMIGFGCLMLAEHRGLRSLGLVMALGSAACLTACLVVLPAFLAYRERGG
jgi:uncharacterized protein